MCACTMSHGNCLNTAVSVLGRMSSLQVSTFNIMVWNISIRLITGLNPYRKNHSYATSTSNVPHQHHKDLSDCQTVGGGPVKWFILMIFQITSCPRSQETVCLWSASVGHVTSAGLIMAGPFLIWAVPLSWMDSRDRRSPSFLIITSKVCCI